VACDGKWIPKPTLKIVGHLEGMDLADFYSKLKLASQQSPDKACPACQTALYVSTDSGIEIDWCSSCEGIWFDSGELKSLIAKRKKIGAGETFFDVLLLLTVFT